MSTPQDRSRELRTPWSQPLKELIRSAARSRGVFVARMPVDTLSEHLRVLLRELRINCVIDVGAHLGEYGALLRRIGYRGRIVSFEPLAESFTLLERRCAADPAWSARKLALGRVNGTRTLNIAEHTTFSSFLEPSGYGLATFPGEAGIVRSEEVKMRTLAEVIDDCIQGLDEPRVFLKVDTQGYDIEVLEGGRTCVDRIVALQTELSVKAVYRGMPTYLEALRTVGGLGFEVTGTYPVVRDRELRVVEFDCVFRRPARPS